MKLDNHNNVAFSILMGNNNRNNTLHASRQICAPRRVAFFQNISVDTVTKGDYIGPSIPAAPLLSMRNSVGFSFSRGCHGIS
jgi:hypothetical protein